jgi:hypothetical protein
MYKHTGGIYKAANFRYLGKTINAEVHYKNMDGVFVHRSVPYRHGKYHGLSTKQAAEALGLKRFKTPKKDRWVYCIDKVTRRRLANAI